ncbi:Isoprenylcysteine carboxyl methyltransferase family-domain-containing protein [Suillus discolor]|uniref:Protein-S-isoprenylcysteine O-methyltransferase n=1 Tax=Suillus discolor TaxID=1912936 RepID=A0A9P7JZ39_9AGAM|nr:Isoprenylcysteine carboxyl methyltransferase family-domain-containing protein [Suillus discolor]KAG2117172.1 Isoprenylcysteine carboxyl methyltransferase family-domain-containing protein [Suillus discolor]
MSLLKIPFLVASAIGVQISFTTSSPPPSSEEKLKPTMLESSFSSGITTFILELLKVSTYTPLSAETANIIAIHMDPSKIPEGIYGAREAVQLLRSLHSTPITPTFLACNLAIVIGGMLRFYCMSTLGKFWSFQLSIRKEHKLVTNGPYSVVRHPSYTGCLLQSVGIIVMYGSPGSWMWQSGILQVPFMTALAVVGCLIYTLAVWVCINRPAIEDKIMQRAMGEEWENWAEKVKYRLLPGVY